MPAHAHLLGHECDFCVGVADLVALVQHHHAPAHRQQQVAAQAQLRGGGREAGGKLPYCGMSNELLALLAGGPERAEGGKGAAAAPHLVIGGQHQAGRP